MAIALSPLAAGLLALLLVGCEGRGVEPTGMATSLAGEWRVARIDDQSLEEPYRLALSGSATEIWWEPRCAGQVRTYRIDGRRIAIPVQSPVPVPTPTRSGAPVTPPPPICAIGLPPRLADAMRALDAAETVVRTPGNGILLEGGGHSVLLFSQ
jgi:hypothetical protein